MATKCPLCRHEFSFPEILRRWNPFTNFCPSCGQALTIKSGLWMAVPLGLLCSFAWFLAPDWKNYGTLLREGLMPWELLKLAGGVLALGILLEWVFWRRGRPGYVPAGSRTAQNASWYRFILTMALPLLAIAGPTAILFHGFGRVEPSMIRYLQNHPREMEVLRQKKLSPEESRKLVLRNFEDLGKRLETDLMVCRGMRIYSGFVLLNLAWLLFWSYRLIFHPWAHPVPAGPKPEKDRKRSSKPRRAKRGR